MSETNDELRVLRQENARLRRELAQASGQASLVNGLRQTQDRLVRRSVVQEGIRRIFQEALARETYDDLVRACLAVAQDVTQARLGFLAEVDEAGAVRDLILSDSAREACRARIPCREAGNLPPMCLSLPGLHGRVIREGKPLTVNDLAGRRDGLSLPEGHPWLESFLGVPLWQGGRIDGLIGLANKPGGFDDRDVAEASEIARASSEALWGKRVALDLRHSEERYHALFQSLDEGFCVVEILYGEDGRPSDYRFLQANPAFERHTGLKGVVGRRMRELLPGQEASWYDLLGRVAETGEPVRYQKEVAALGRHFEGYAFRIGEPAQRQVAVLFSDVSGRKAAEEALRASEERYHALFESMDQGFCVVEMLYDESGRPSDYRFLQANPAFERHSGLNGVVGRRICELLPDQEDFWFELFGRVAETGEPVRFQGGVASLGRHFEGSAFRIGGPEQGQVAILFSDVSGRRAAQEALEQAKAEAEMRAHEAEEGKRILDAITEYIPVGMVVVDAPDMRVRVLSKSAVKISGRTYEELTKGPEAENTVKTRVTSPDGTVLPRDMFPLMRSIRDGEICQNVELAYENPQGRHVPLLVSTAPIRDGQGRITGAIGMFNDITVLKQALEAVREGEERYRALVEGAGDAYLVHDMDGRLIEVNQMACDSMGYTREELLALTLADVELDFSTERMRQDWASGSAPGRPATVYGYHRRKDGSIFPVEGRLTNMDLRGKPVVLALFRDITEREEGQRRLEQAKDEAERANRAKSEFLANMSHEIRTPMNGVLGMTELALTEDVSPRAREYLQYVKQSGKSLLDIINDILDLSKVEAGKVELVSRPFSLREALESTMKAHAVTARTKGLSITSAIGEGVPDRLVGDAGRLRQVLTNILGNAVKFTDKGSVRLSVDIDGSRRGEPGTARLLFRVKDDGVGIPADRLEEVFEAFSQVGLSSHIKYGGTGLGLAISKSLIEMMDGRIWANSQVGRGTTFYFTAAFALQQAERPAVEQPETAVRPAAGAVRPLTILVAEDDPVSRLFAINLLKDKGHRVEAVENGRDALDRLRDRPFDVVLMDVRMPDMDGVAAVKAIRGGEAGAERTRVPVVALTAHALRGDREKYLAAGMDDYLSKPLEIEELDRVLSGVGGRKEKRNT